MSDRPLFAAFAPPPEEREERRPVVLLADDDPDTRALLSRYLDRGGYRAIVAVDGADVLPLARGERPDLIVLDVNMPGMDGYRACAELQGCAETRFVPVVFATACAEQQDKAQAFSVGAADYLVKPVTRELLLDTVRRHLDTRSRWNQVATAAELWDDAPLPQKFLHFRDELARELDVDAGTRQRLAGISSRDVYLFTTHLNLSYEELAQRMAGFFGVEYLPQVDAETIQLGVLPAAFCKKNQVVTVRDECGGDSVVIVNPFNWGLAELDVIGNAFRGRPYRLLITHRGALRPLFVDEPAAAPEFFDHTGPPGAGGPELSLDTLLSGEREAGAVEIVNTLITDAARRRASDLHIQPSREHVHVRYRIDGRLHDVMPLPRPQLPSIVARIKILCGMDVSETRSPQDGSCKMRVDGKEIELRASTLPITHGEKVVFRLLTSTAERYQLDRLGMAPDTLREFRSALASRQGIILTTGPTGSGKTTTLYSALNHLHRPELNIVTVEDPVELDVDGISQVQVHDRAGRTFAAVLRAMLRQDPDVIMVGEVRDCETAEIACRAAMTGHLVLSTLHTPTALAALPRLLDMGIPAYLAASSLTAVVSQRLVHRVCERCAAPYDPPEPLRSALAETFGNHPNARFRRGAGCQRCRRTGSVGRIGVYEILTLDDDLRHLVTSGAAPSVLREYVERRGYRTLEEDAFHKAASGLIAPEEIVELGFSLARAVAYTARAGAAPASPESRPNRAGLPASRL